MYGLRGYAPTGYGFGYLGLGYENCDPRDFACVQRNGAAEAGIEQQGAIDATNAARDLCNANADRSDEPWRSQLHAACAANYPAGAATEGESVQFWATQATPAAKVDEYATAAQSSAEFNAEAARRAAELRAELARANQTFIPDSVRLSGPVSHTTVPPQQQTSAPLSNILPGVTANPVIGSTSTNWLQSITSQAGGFSLASVPWWGWAAGLGVAVLAIGKGGR